MYLVIEITQTYCRFFFRPDQFESFINITFFIFLLKWVAIFKIVLPQKKGGMRISNHMEIFPRALKWLQYQQQRVDTTDRLLWPVNSLPGCSRFHFKKWQGHTGAEFYLQLEKYDCWWKHWNLNVKESTVTYSMPICSFSFKHDSFVQRIWWVSNRENWAHNFVF